MRVIRKILGSGLSLLCAVVVLIPGEAWALDGRLDVRGSRNEGLAGTDAFTTSILRRDVSFEQQVRLSPNLLLRADYRDLNEWSESRSDLFRSEYDTRTLLPSLSLNFRSRNFRSGLSVDGSRRDYDGAGFGNRRDERLEGAAYLQYNFTRGNFTLRANDTSSDRRSDFGDRIENHDRSLRSGLQYDTTLGEFQYTGTVSRDEAITAGIRRDRTTHGLRYRGAGSWNQGRARASLEARTDLFDETTVSELSVTSMRLTPIFTGYALDDTPEQIDPLEPDPAPLPELSDADRDTPSPLDIGDDAAPVREYGGDYRNLVIDFGDPQAVGSARLYVDRIVRFPEFLQWRLYTSDDPLGIDWTEVAPGTLAAAWREWTDGRQGWDLTLAAPVTARRFKFVDVKTGPTEPAIFLNELELYDPLPSTERRVESSSRRHRLLGTVAYDLTRRLTVGYRGTFTKREYDNDAGDLTGTIHTFDSRLRLDGLSLSAIYGLNRLESPSRLNTDTRTINLAATTDTDRPFWTRITWHRNMDASLERDRTTDDYGLDISWRAAPGLTLLQKVGRGVLDDEVYALTSRSWFSVTTLRSQPRASLLVDISRSSRWVSRDVGEDYSSFNDTDGTVRWSIFPLLSYTGQVRYESRDTDEWLWRHTLSWNPLSTGSLDMQFSLNHYSDTRTDTRQRGGGVNMTWRARPRLRLEGRVDVQDHERGGVTSTPLNTQWRATWTF
jgi:hypothetical protein